MSSDSSTDQAIDWYCFSYLTVDKAAVYRAIVQVFADAKAEFTLHLRPAQVRETLHARNCLLEADEVEAALQQLEAWGNLQSYQDRSDAPSLVEFYRKSLLYQMTASGEAAYASTLTFVERLQQQAKLDARALDRIGEGAGQMERLVQGLREDPKSVDSGVVLTTIRSICQDTDELTSRAQSFFRWLHEQTESDRADLESFLRYKEQLIDYLRQFVSDLITRGSQIAKRLSTIHDAEYGKLAQIAAVEEVGDPRAGEEGRHAERIGNEQSKWQQRLLGLRGWFSRRGGSATQLEQLRSAARGAIPRLLQFAAQMNERETGKSDRVADLRRLAVAFLECQDDEQGHRLYREAFALCPARHLRIDQATIDDRDQNPISSDTRWLDADPIEFSPQLRSTGRESAASASRKAVDRSQALAAARRRLETEIGRVDSSRETLISLGRRRLSEIGELDSDAFRLLMELIELAIVDKRAKTTSRDGSVRITVEASGEDAQHIATVATSKGKVMLQDMWIEVQRAR
ncbi:TIGR02677 family protein [bacterium]|nr:TIGR02677 family protein [bacterium]